MKKQLHKHASCLNIITILAGFLIVMLGLVLSVAVQPAQASPLPQVATATVTATPTGSATVAATTGAGTLTVTPAVTATRSGTLAAPVATGTSSALVPVTGADLTNQGGGESNVGIWLAVWLVGLLLVGFGLRARLSKHS